MCILCIYTPIYNYISFIYNKVLTFIINYKFIRPIRV